ncbi:MAG: PA2779 family protein [Haliea sp.]|uniref:PA2779 family protein n=1 Tax=Haliea sp. TaxID=1932666 RepID=UPI0032F00F39
MLNTRLVVLLQILALLVASTVGTAQAAVIGTADHFAQQSRNEQLGVIDAALTRDTVQQQMVAMGVSHADAMARIGALSDAELQQLAQNIETLPAGSSALGVLGALFLVLLVLEIVGVTNVFTKL